MQTKKFDKARFDALVATVEKRGSATPRQKELLADLLEDRVPRYDYCPFCNKNVNEKRYWMRNHLKWCPFTCGEVEKPPQSSAAATSKDAEKAVKNGKRKHDSDSESESSEEDDDYEEEEGSSESSEKADDKILPVKSSSAASAPLNKVATVSGGNQAPAARASSASDLVELQRLHKYFDPLLNEWTLHIKRNQLIQDTAMKLIEADPINEEFACSLLTAAAKSAQDVYKGTVSLNEYHRHINSTLGDKLHVVFCGHPTKLPKKPVTMSPGELSGSVKPKSGLSESLNRAFCESFWISSVLQKRISAANYAKKCSIEALEFDQEFLPQRIFLAAFSFTIVSTRSDAKLVAVPASAPAPEKIPGDLTVSRAARAENRVDAANSPSSSEHGGDQSPPTHGFFSDFFGGSAKK